MRPDSQDSLVQRYAQDTVITTNVLLPPHLLRYNLNTVLRNRLTRANAGRCTEEHGFVLGLRRVTSVTGGIIDRMTTGAYFTVECVAETLRPEVGDVIEAVVHQANKIGLFAKLGPLSVFVPLSRIPDDYRFETQPRPHFRAPELPDLKPGAIIRVQVQLIEMLDETFAQSSDAPTALKAMGALVV